MTTFQVGDKVQYFYKNEYDDSHIPEIIEGTILQLCHGWIGDPHIDVEVEFDKELFGVKRKGPYVEIPGKKIWWILKSKLVKIKKETTLYQKVKNIEQQVELLHQKIDNIREMLIADHPPTKRRNTCWE